METITVTRPMEWETCELHVFADVHLGDMLLDGNLLKERISYCEEKENCIVILNGDICNAAVKNSVSDVYSESIRPMEQLKTAERLFKKLADQGKLVLITDGNHERRIYRNDGIDMSALIAAQLGVPYSPGAAVIFLRFGKEISHCRRILYTIYCAHGGGGGSKIGGKANRLLSMAESIDCDVYVHSHVHEPLIVKRAFYRVNAPNSSVQRVDRLFINTAAYLDYGGYAEQAELPAGSKATPVVYLSGRRRNMIAQM